MIINRLDIGCGDKPKEGYYGIDINPDYKPDMVHNVDWGIPFASNSMDAIWMDNSLEHFQDPLFVLKECKRVLKKDGIIEIIIPNLQWPPLLILSWFVDIHKFWNWWMNRKKNRGLHYTLWTPYTLRWLLTRLEFNIEKENGGHLSKEYYIKARK